MNLANPTPHANGPKQDKLIRDALKAAIRQSPEKLKKAAEKVLDEAAEGSISHMQFMAERIDGKVPQAVVGDKNEDAIQVEHRVLTKEQSEDLFIAAALKGLVKQTEIPE